MSRAHSIISTLNTHQMSEGETLPTLPQSEQDGMRILKSKFPKGNLSAILGALIYGTEGPNVKQMYKNVIVALADSNISAKDILDYLEAPKGSAVDDKFPNVPDRFKRMSREVLLKWIDSAGAEDRPGDEYFDDIRSYYFAKYPRKAPTAPSRN